MIKIFNYSKRRQKKEEKGKLGQIKKPIDYRFKPNSIKHIKY